MGNDREDMKRWHRRGARMFTGGEELGFVASGSVSILGSFKGLTV